MINIFIILLILPFVFAGPSLIESHLLEAELLKMCRTELVTLQEKSSIKLNHLLSLNPQADALNTKLALANKKRLLAIATKNAALLTIATTEILQIKMQQKVLGTQQSKILLALEAEKNIYAKKTHLEMQKKIYRFQKIPQSLLKIENPIVTNHLQAASFSRTPAYSLAPRIEPARDFSQKQEVIIKWQYLLNNNNFVKKWLNINTKRKNLCAATLIPKNMRWQASLSEVKF